MNTVPDVPLWFVRGDPNYEDDTDLLVYANDRDQAIFLWRQYFTLELSNAPEYVGKVPKWYSVGAVSWTDIMKSDREEPQ